MKFTKTFFIIFIVTYIIIGYLSTMVVGIKWDESASTLTKFLVISKIALIDGYLIKGFISLVCAAMANFLSSKK